MIHQILSTTWKDLQIIFKDTGGIATLFLMPLMFIIVMSTAMQGMFDTSVNTEPRRLPVANLDRGPYADQIINALANLDGIEVETTWGSAPISRELAEELVADGSHAVAVVFPADFSEQVEAQMEEVDTTATVGLITDPAVSIQFIAPIQGMIFGVAERVVETKVAQARIAKTLTSVFAEMPAEARPSPDQLAIDTGGGNAVQLKQVAPEEMDVPVYPDSYQQNVPGYTVFGVFFIVGTMASSILTEKEKGTFRRLLVAPLPKPVLLAGKILPYYLINLIQIAIMFSVARLLFGMALSNPIALVAISMALSAAATGMGIMIAALGKTEAQVNGLTTLLTLTLAAIGGCLMPTFVMPSFLRTLSQVTPHAWAMQGFQDVLVRGYGLSGILLESGILMGFAAIFFAIGVWCFRFD